MHFHKISILTSTNCYIYSPNLNTSDSIKWIGDQLLKRHGLVWRCSKSKFFELKHKRNISETLKQLINVEVVSKSKKEKKSLNTH